MIFKHPVWSENVWSMHRAWDQRFLWSCFFIKKSYDDISGDENIHNSKFCPTVYSIFTRRYEPSRIICTYIFDIGIWCLITTSRLCKSKGFFKWEKSNISFNNFRTLLLHCVHLEIVGPSVYYKYCATRKYDFLWTHYSDFQHAHKTCFFT